MQKDKAILIIEDNIVTRGMIKKILAGHGYDVSAAVDGVDAVLHLTKRNFDLILCDIYMPNLNGFQLMEFLNRKQLKIPVIFLTASDRVEDEVKGLILGAEDYIRKPIDKDVLLLRVERIIRNSKARISLGHPVIESVGENRAKSIYYDS